VFALNCVVPDVAGNKLLLNPFAPQVAALVEDHVSVVGWPTVVEVRLAERVTVGATELTAGAGTSYVTVSVCGTTVLLSTTEIPENLIVPV
jgi:hypothetical protein